MDDFFRHARTTPSLTMFINAGDPPLEVLRDIILMLDEERVACVELAVPFPNSVTDGTVVRESASRALARGIGLDEVLSFTASLRPHLRGIRIAVLADWSHTLKGRKPNSYLSDSAGSGVDAFLAHGLPPRLAEEYYSESASLGFPVIGTCYPQSSPETMERAASRSSAFLYLVAQYGRSGKGPADGHAALADTVSDLRLLTKAPIAIGFGVRSKKEVLAVGKAGADSAVIGSAGVAVLAKAQEERQDVVRAFRTFIRSCDSATEGVEQ